ncbi:MAG: ATP synthase F1 subunit gamma [Ardenticatenaceae bacterium]|nr:ATP synthase F1 subunit gamma [Ardenticatenaceae bacterium]MCB9443244.1 ATP synthase F1 subunit gamma [Ardenticatenaceae bacterium]
MATERELNKRIKSIGNISQVTGALAAVSASKASKSQRQVEATRAYAGKAFEILNNLASQPGVGSSGHPLLTVRDEIKTAYLVLITSDRGLAGAYNSNIVSRAEAFIRAMNVPVKVITVGRKGRDLMIRRGYNVIATFDDMPDSLSILDIMAIAKIVTNDYLEGKADEVFVAYTDFVNLVTRIPRVKQLLPLKPLDFEGMAVAEYVSSVDLSGVSERVYSYEPEPAALLDTVVPRFTQLQLYQAMLEAQASEHSARMVAMNNATDNAAELIDILTLERNKARQTTITSEILDIVGGAEALG